jgi:uncharacterized membrane protein YebE (DUF533 family)
MTPAEKNIVKSLIAVAWADGTVDAPEQGVIEGLLSGFDATQAEQDELLEYARTRRTLDVDFPVSELSEEDRELLLGNAALLTHADGDQSESEKVLLDKLVAMLGFGPDKTQEILTSVSDGALRLGSRVLLDDD